MGEDERVPTDVVDGASFPTFPMSGTCPVQWPEEPEADRVVRLAEDVNVLFDVVHERIDRLTRAVGLLAFVVGALLGALLAFVVVVL